MSIDRRSILRFFVIGFCLMLIPLAMILFWNQMGCYAQILGHAAVSHYCLPGNLDKSMELFLPFIMIVGGAMVGYNLKRISDSNLPPPDDKEEEEEPEGESSSETEQPE